MPTLSLKGLTSVFCEGMHGPEDVTVWERIAGWPLYTQLQCKANIHTRLQHQHPAAARIAVNTKDQLSKRIPLSLAPLGISCWSRGFLMLFLQSGSAVSTHNVRLCPLMLPALILIANVLLSTSSITSKPTQHMPIYFRKKPFTSVSLPWRFFYVLLFCSKEVKNR